MPVSDLDIWRSAKLLVDQHGTDAPNRAAQRAGRMLAAGGDLRTVQELLGHASLSTTRRCTQVEMSQLIALCERARLRPRIEP